VSDSWRGSLASYASRPCRSPSGSACWPIASTIALFGHDVSRREWIGVALTAAGLAFLAATPEGTGDSAAAPA
jgi:drug/metabolite transporter (DMT)-like permease